MKTPYLYRYIKYKQLKRHHNKLGKSEQLHDCLFPGIEHRFKLRPNTSDMKTFKQVIVKEEYFVRFINPPSVIIDAGANIGLSAIYFANLFPEAKIISLEPELSNFSLLKENTKWYKNVIPIQAALWHQDTELIITNPEADHWAFQVGENKQSTASNLLIPAVTIDALCKQFHIKNIDLLKIDIEGAEEELFKTNTQWLERVGFIAIELHDRFKANCTENFNFATTQFIERTQKGETTFIAKENIIKQ